MSSSYYNHHFHNFLASKNDKLLAQNAIGSRHIAYYKHRQKLTFVMRNALKGLVFDDALNTCHVAHITKHTLVISTMHGTIASHLKSIPSLILAQLAEAHEDFSELNSIRVAVFEHVELKNHNS